MHIEVRFRVGYAWNGCRILERIGNKEQSISICASTLITCLRQPARPQFEKGLLSREFNGRENPVDPALCVAFAPDSFAADALEGIDEQLNHVTLAMVRRLMSEHEDLHGESQTTVRLALRRLELVSGDTALRQIHFRRTRPCGIVRA